MKHPYLNQTPNPSLRQTISIKKNRTLQANKEMTYLTRDYFVAIKEGKPLPQTPLPPLNELLEANMVIDAYMKSRNTSLSIKLWNACLPVEQVVAVWFFANEPTVNVKIGNHQMFVIKHH